MVKVVDISIPPGLEDLWNKFFQFGNNITQTSYNTKSHTKTRQKKKRLRERSLFLLWQSLYDGFDSTRKSAWTAYWITLPFGDHGGANGWPGSGFSAFVYVNAPLYKLGEDLLLDPPAYPELVFNGGFIGNANGWDIFDGAFYSSNAMHFLSTSQYMDFGQQEAHSFSIVDGATYRMQFDYVLTAGQFSCWFYNNESADIVDEIIVDVGSGHATKDIYIPPFTYPPDFWIPFFINYVDYSEGYITNVSIKRIS